MNLSFFRLHSLKTKVTLFTLVIFVISIWTISFYIGRMLHMDMERVLGEQQFTTASLVANDINEDIQDRLDALVVIADSLAPTLPGGAAATQKALESFPIFQRMFNAGTVVTGLDGTAIASVPALGRVGVNYMDRDQVATALKDGRSSVGKPVLGKVLKEPIVSMAAPIRDARGLVIGAVIGVTDVGMPNFLDKIAKSTSGKNGAVSLVSLKHRLTVTSTDKKLVLFTLPAPGVNPYLDRNMAGFEGSTIVTNVLGQEQLAAVKQIPAAQWYLFSGLPAEEVFAPVRAMHERVLLATILLTLLAGGLTWWILKRQLAPMFETASKLAHMAVANDSPQPLTITRQDEIGELIAGFNRLLDTLARREEALRNSEVLRGSILDSVTAEIAVLSRDGTITAVNAPWIRFATENGLTPDQPAPCTGVGSNYLAVCVPDDETAADDTALSARQGIEAVLDGSLPSYYLEYPCHSPHQQRWFSLSATPLGSTGLGAVISHTDITERKQAEQALQQSLKDQHALLMEVHHRVKNNLQVISSLLRMEAQRSQQADTQAVLTEMQGRIRSMALLHKALYHSGTFASVDLGNYLHQVATQAFSSHSLHSDLVRLTLDLGALQVGMDQAISAGLLVNELISNCLKHGFPQDRAGAVSVVLLPVDAQTDAADALWRICVSDTGVGLPPDFEERRKTSLGLQLVDDLSQQIGGGLGVASKPGEGAQFTVTFTALAPKSLVMPI